MSQDTSPISNLKLQSPTVAAADADAGLETVLFEFEAPAMPTLSAAAPETGPLKFGVKKETVEKLVVKVKEL